MKFEKFFKSAGIYGKVISRGYKKWLVCGGVGMVVPDGLCENLSKGVDSGKAKMIVDALCETFDQEPVVLSRAYLAKDGRPSEVLRIFRDDGGNEVAISNKDFGLLERSDIALYWVDIEDDTDEDKDPQTLRFLIVQDSDDNVIGFIHGINPNGLF